MVPKHFLQGTLIKGNSTFKLPTNTHRHLSFSEPLRCWWVYLFLSFIQTEPPAAVVKQISIVNELNMLKLTFVKQQMLICQYLPPTFVWSKRGGRARAVAVVVWWRQYSSREKEVFLTYSMQFFTSALCTSNSVSVFKSCLKTHS